MLLGRGADDVGHAGRAEEFRCAMLPHAGTHRAAGPDMSPLLGCLFSGCVVAVSACTVGCAAPTGDDAESGDSAYSAGTRFTSPLKVGVYDAKEATLVVYSQLDRQRVELNGMAGTEYCDGAVDVEAGLVTALDPEHHCTMKLTTSGRDIEMRGGEIADFSARFIARPANALKGTYQAAGATLSIVSSSATAPDFEYEFTFGAETYRGAVTRAGMTGSASYATKIRGCAVSLRPVRTEGKFEFWLRAATDDIKCTQFDLTLVSAPAR